MSSGLNTLLEELLSWITVTDGHGLSDVLPDVLTVEQVRELSYIWAKARDSVRAALLNLTSEPTSRLFYRSSLLSSTRSRSVMTRWMMNI